MDKNYDTKSIENILTMLKGFVYNVEYKNFFVNIHITTSDGVCRNLKLSNNQNSIFEVNKNILVYKDSALSLKDIIKIKISLQDVQDKNLKELLNKRLRNIILYNNRNSQIKNQGLARKYTYRNDDYDIESYIQNNNKNIRNIGYSCIKNQDKSITINTELEDVLSKDSSIDIYKEDVIESIDINLESCEVINSIEHSRVDVVTNVNIEEKAVLTNNANEIEVARPIQIKEVDIINDLNIREYNIMTEPVSTSAIKDINYNKSEVITNLDTDYIKNALVNINSENQILKSKKIEVLEIEPINKYIDKSELSGRRLRFDPTGENYIGVVLDDGTFEPLKLELKSYKVLDEKAENYIGNIDANNQLQDLISKIDVCKSEAIDNIKVEYKNDLVEYREESIKDINDIITTSKEKVNSVLNYNDTAKAITKDKTEIINHINSIESSNISTIDNLKTTKVIDNINLETKTKDIVSDIEFNKKSEKVIKEIPSITEYNNLNEEGINGSIELVGGGIIVVENNEDITIYQASKVTSVN